MTQTVVAFEPITHAVDFVVHASLEASRRGFISKKYVPFAGSVLPAWV